MTGNRHSWNMTQERLREVPVFSVNYNETLKYLQLHPNNVFVRYEDYRFLERLYEDLLKQVRRNRA